MTTTEITKKKGMRVGTEHVDRLVGTYKKERWAMNSKRLGKPDSLSAWYGIDELSAFLELAKSHQADGIKMYYGVYPSDSKTDPDMHGRQTVVLVATKEKTAHGMTVNKDIYVQNGEKNEILAFNYATICPPYCGTPPDDFDRFIRIDTASIGLIIEESEGRITIQ